MPSDLTTCLRFFCPFAIRRLSQVGAGPMSGKEVHMIHIEDRHVYRGPGIYVGREMPALGLKGSVLGNRCEGRTREERVANFRSWLWEKMQLRGEEYRELRRIADLTLHSDVILICWCFPKLCHAMVIRSAVEFLLSPEGQLWEQQAASGEL
jgi:hypothetical protein